MDKILISIIIPVYKVEQYLARCIESIISQTFTDWECILIDDGSPDGSGEICDYYAKQDCRLRVIHKNNEGVSAARNEGLKVARGEWITFVDSDDFLEPIFLEDLYKPVIKYRSISFVHAGCVNFYENGTTTPNQKYSQYFGDNKTILFEGFRGLVFSKLFKKSILLNNNILFDTRIRLAEDYIFTLNYLFFVDTFVFVESAGYNYFIRKGSATNSITRPEFHEGLFICAKQNCDLVSRYISFFNPSEKACLKRQKHAAQSLLVLLSLYTYEVDFDTRMRILHMFDDKKYKEFVKYTGSGILKRIILKMLITPSRRRFVDKILSKIYEIRRML